MDSLRMLELGDWTIVESKCQGMFTDLRYFQAGSRVQNLPFDITRLDNLRFLDNNSQQSMGIVPNKVPSSLRIVKSMDLQLCQYINMNKLPKACKLKTLDIRGSNLQMLPETFSELDALEEIFLSKCYRLKILRDSFANLRSLNMLDLSHCAALRCLPSSFGWLSSLERVNFSYCTGLKHLPESIGLLSSVKEIDLSYCKRIKKLPKDLVKLSTLRVLKLKACTHLLELPQGFQSLSLEELSLESCNRLKLLPEEIQSTSKQKTVSLSWCFTVEELSKGFINLIKPSVEHLILADCIGLKTLPEELPAELSGLKSINLSGCINLLSLPKRFHKLQYLEKLDLSSCERLEEDSIRLGRLSSLKEVNLSKCKGLKGSCLTNLSRISSLTFVDIRGSPYLADHWNQMRKENKIFHLTAATGSPGVGCRSFFPSLAKSLDFEKELHLGTLEFFHDKWPFVDFDGSQFYPSTLKTGTTLGVIFDHDYAKEEVQELEKILNDLRATSHCFQIFHVGNLVSSFGKELTRRLRVWTSDNYEAHVFFQKALSTIESYDEKRRYAMIICNVQKLKAGKGFSTWTSITNDSLKVTTVDVPKEELFRLKELTESPQESNLKTLKALLLTKDINFLITRRNQMEINNLEGKFVFLLFSWLHKFEEEKTAFKDVYEELKILIEMKPVFEVVWIPIVIEGRDTRALHANAVLEIPWPSIADPWSISPNAMQLFRKHPGFNKLPLLTVVYPDGKLCFENIIPKAKQFEEETIKKLEEMIKIEEEALKCLDAERKSERAEENEVEEEGAERKEIIKNLEKKIMAEKKKVVARNIYRIIKEREEKICSTR